MTAIKIPFGDSQLECYPGGTGPCWNIRDADDEGANYLHVCDLDDLIAALHTLKNSDAHKANVKRWE
jgi:hypothetical protein